MRDKFSAFIRDPDLEKLKLSLKTTNIFNILRLESAEIRHSNFLSWLLDPNGSHNLGDIFLRWFLKDIFSDEKVAWTTEFEADSYHLANVKLYREWKNIDILIEADEFVVCIENKVFAQESEHQLSVYRERVLRNFPNKHHAFVFLTPDGHLPKKLQDLETYVIYSYEEIKRNLAIVQDIYADSLSDKVKYYLDDYMTIIRRDIMKDHESIALARSIYMKHKEALDFIFENRPDRLGEIGPIVEKVVQQKGYVLQTINKGYVRFTTPQLLPIVPKTGTYGFSGKEAFVFEIDFWPKNVTLKTVIPPGEEHNKQVLKEAIARVDGAKEPTGSKWLVQFSKIEKIDLTSDKYEDDASIESVIAQMLDKNKDWIESVEAEIVKVKDQLEFR